MNRNAGENAPRGTVLQFGVGWAWELLQIGEPAWRRWADAHGFAYSVEKVRHFDDRTPHWEKIFLINEWLRDSEPGDLLLWADSDTYPVFPVDLSVSPWDVLTDEADIAMCRTIYGNWNSGLMFIRSSKMSAKFFDSVWCLGPVPKWGTRWNDEARINADLPYWQRKGLKAQQLDPKWNDFDRLPIRASDPLVKSWHGTPKDTVLRRMKEEAAKCLS